MSCGVGFESSIMDIKIEPGISTKSEPDGLVVADEENTDYINTLPEELLLMIFSYLEHRDQLEVRRVCSRWSKTLISWHRFLNSVTFVLVPSTNAYATLLASDAPWKHIKIEGVSDSDLVPDWFSNLSIPSVKRIIILNSLFSWDWFQRLLCQFPHFDELEIINSKTKAILEELKLETTREINDAFRVDEFRHRVKSLKLEVNEVRSLSFFLQNFTGPGSRLAQLVINFKPSLSTVEDEETLRHLGAMIYTTFNFCSTTLTSLSLSTLCTTINEGFFLLLLNEFEDKQLNLRSFHLDYENPQIPATEHIASQQPKLFRFLKSQPNMTSLTLPPLNLSSVEELANSLPKNLTDIRLGSVTLLSVPGLVQKLMTMKDMTLYCKSAPEMFFHALPFFQGKVFSELRSLTILGKPGGVILLISQGFSPNLTKLVITCSTEENSATEIHDLLLQIIVSHLIHLQVLKLSSCTRVTDFGVTGIMREFTESLLRSKAVYLAQDLSKFQFARRGVALQSLKGLRELSLTGSSQISDVGVQYGLGFRDLRKLELVSTNKKLSDWGVVQLAKLNRKLETISVSTVQSQKLCKTTRVKGIIKELLPRVKRLGISVKSSALVPPPTSFNPILIEAEGPAH